VVDLALALESESARRFGPDDPILDGAVMKFFNESYAPRARWADPFVSPLRAELSKFPPTCIVVGTIDPLLDDGLAFAEKLRAAGRDVTLLRYEGMPHVFMLFPGIDAGPKAIQEASDFLRARASG
jgi:acetyl esterase/lipase